MHKNSIIVLFFIPLLLMNCTSTPIIDIQGHRGCRGLMPENTLPAFKKAIELGVHTLELDVVISKDKQVIVSHEPYMSRVFCLDPTGNSIPEADDKKINLYQMTYHEIKQYDCGTKWHPRYPDQKKVKAYKPSLDEVIKMADSLNKEIRYNIEIKAKEKYDVVYTPETKEFVNLVLNIIKTYNISNRTNLQSFDLRILEEIKKQDPKIQVAILIDEDETIAEKLSELSYKPEIISPYYKLLTASKVKQYQAEDYKIIPWTVNSEDDIQHMIDYNVDGIITDFPDRLINLLKD